MDTEKVPNESLTLECGSSLAEWEHSTLPQTSRSPYSNSTNQTQHRLVVGENNADKQQQQLDQLRTKIRNDVVGSGTNSFQSPFEMNHQHPNLPLIYCDHTASSRPLQSVEEYISNVCLPYYGNTHTNTSITGSQSTAFVAEARQIVAENVNARISGKAAVDVVLFAGSGATSCVQLLLDCLGLNQHNIALKEKDRPVVFVGPFEHHSNLLPWRESGCEIITIPESNTTGDVDLEILEERLSYLRHESPNRIFMGTFTATSNVTGLVSDVDAIASLLHEYNALAFFDYATGAPYLDIDMNPSSTTTNSKYKSNNISKDAIFFSPHKMMGGINTSGVLVMKKHLVDQVSPPARSGGGTVFYVTNTHHRFLSNRMERFEGGTPNIIGVIRTGMTFLVKRRIHDEFLQIMSSSNSHNHHHHPPTLMDMEFQTHERVVQTLRQTAPNLIILGTNNQTSTKTKHIPIFSFLIKCGHRFLHYNYVCAILNDIFGIQSRGGCQCAGPFSQRLLGLVKTQKRLDKHGKEEVIEIPNKSNDEIENALLYHKEKAELLRPGYTRLSLPFKGLCDIEIDYVLRALAWTAKHAWVFMPQYRCNHRTGEWRHHIRQGKPLGDNRRWISHYDILSPKPFSFNHSNSHNNDLTLKQHLDHTLHQADLLLSIAKNDKMNITQALNMGDANGILGTEDNQTEDSNMGLLRWYVYPKECALWLKEELAQPPGMDLREELLGALKPRECCDSNPNDYQMALKSNETMSDSILPPQKRKFEDPTKRTNIVEQEMKEIKLETKEKPETSKKMQKDENKYYNFRDGEHHSGSAPLDEIEGGYDEGELSENCEIFSLEDDAWINIETFLNAQTESKTSSDMDLSSMVQDKPNNEPKDKKVFSSESNKKDHGPKKKPARDSSSWGRTANVSPHINLVGKDNAALNPQKTESVGTTSKNGNSIPKLSKNKQKKKNKPPPKMMRYINQAIIQFNMIEEGDNLLLGLSGGKDSLSLLHCLIEMKRKLPINFTLQVCTIDPMTPSFDPSPLIPYVRDELGLKYHYIRDDIVARASSSGKNGKVVSSLCSFCARMKRGNLYTTARRNNCNKLVLAQHLDDCAESMMMSMMHNGFLRTMKANYKINAGDLGVIRPMVYCRESLMTEYAKSAGLPVINENCPACFEEPKERDRVKKLLSREETLYPNLYDNLRRALIPLLHEDSTSIMRCYTEETLEKSRKVPGKPKKFLNYTPKDPSSMEVTSNEEKKSQGEDNISLNEILQQNKATSNNVILSNASEEDLIAELARRRSLKFKMHGAMRRLGENDDDDDHDPTGQVCSLKGSNGGSSIPCYELME